MLKITKIVILLSSGYVQFTIYKLKIIISDITPWFTKASGPLWVYSYASDFYWKRTQTHNTLVSNHSKEYVVAALLQLH